MKKQNIFSMALCALMATATLTSCEGALDDIFGEWSRPVKQLSIEETPLTFEAVEAGTITISYKGGLTLPKPITYTKNGVSTSITADTDIAVAAGDIVSFSSENSTLNDDGSGYLNILADHKIYVYGNAMSLINDEGDFSKDKTISGEYAFGALLYANEKLFNHPEKEILLPATTLSEGCYDMMFRGCLSLSKAPELPATKLTPECYYQMFRYCTALTTAPALPATELTTECYYQMFYNCTSLTTAPALPATELAERCYMQMFNSCRKLIAAPALPATTLKKECYHTMFAVCEALTETPHLAAETLADDCYVNMFQNCTALTKAYVKAGYDATKCKLMFDGCTDATGSTFYSADANNYKTAFSLSNWTPAAYQ